MATGPTPPPSSPPAAYADPPRVVAPPGRPARLARPAPAAGREAARALSVGFGLMLAAFAMFVVMDTSAKWLVLSGLAALQVAFTRFAVHLALVLAVYGPREGGALLRSNAPRLQLVRGALLASTTLLNFTALKFLPLPVTISIFFAGPLLVCLLSIPVLGERVGPRRFLAVAAGFAGVLVILQPWSERFDWHVLLSLGSMACGATYFVLSRLIRGADGNGTTQLYASLTGTFVLAPFALHAWTWPADAAQWGLLLLLGTLGLTGHSLVVRAHELAEASVLAPTVYSQILYVSVASWAVFGQPPEAATLAGSAMVIASGLYVWWRERSLTRAPAV